MTERRGDGSSRGRSARSGPRQLGRSGQSQSAQKNRTRLESTHGRVGFASDMWAQSRAGAHGNWSCAGHGKWSQLGRWPVGWSG
jgi:hypothetical protein